LFSKSENASNDKHPKQLDGKKGLKHPNTPRGLRNDKVRKAKTDRCQQSEKEAHIIPFFVTSFQSPYGEPPDRHQSWSFLPPLLAVTQKMKMGHLRSSSCPLSIDVFLRPERNLLSFSDK
jgi:hypothetical protein